MPTTRSKTKAAMAETGTAGIVPTGTLQEGGASTFGAIAPVPPCANPNETLPPASRTSSSIVPQSARSGHSSSTLKAQILTAKAEHARRLANVQAERDRSQAERDRCQAERETAVAELELQAKLAVIQANSISAGSRHSDNSHCTRPQHRVEDWLAESCIMFPKRDNKAHSFVDRGANKPRFSNVVPQDRPRSSPATAYGDGPVTVTHPPLDVLDRTRGARPVTTCAPPRQAPTHPQMHPAPAGTLTHPSPCVCTLPVGAYSSVEPAEHTQHALGLGTLTNDENCCYKNKNHCPDLRTSFNQLADAIRGTGKKTTKVCDITKFDGHVSDWFHFKKSYEQSKTHFSPSDNITRLGAALHGAAKEAVSIRLIAADDPEQIVQALETRFAQPEVIVLHQISEVKTLPKISLYESARELNIFACRIRNCVEIIRLLNLPEHLASPDLLNIIISKLTPLLRSKWRDFASSRVGSGKFKLEILADFLEIEAKLQIKFDVIVSEPNSVKSQCHPIKTTRDKTYAIATVSNVTSKPKSFYSCQYCHDGKHEVSDCEGFKSLPLDDRWQWVMENKVCRRCLKKGSHQYRHCKKKCKFEGCPVESRHHTLLHRPQPVTTAHVEIHSAAEILDPMKPSTSKEEQRSVTVAHNSSPLNSSCLKPLLKVVAVTISGPLGSVNTYALLDDGSSVTLLDQSVADSVGAEGPMCRLNIDCISGLSTQADVRYVNILVKGRYGTDSFDIRARTIPDLGIKRQAARLDDVARYDYLSDLVDVVCYDDAKPMLLIGADNWHMSLPSEVRHGTREQPAAARTALGWVLYGYISSRSYAATSVNHISVTVDNDSLDNLIKEYFRLDSIGITKVDHRSASEQRALNILEETTKRLNSGRYEAGLLWRDNISTVPKSRDLALSRFVSLERKMAKDSAYADAYKQNIQEMISKGYAELCSGPPSGQVPWYLPHFGVTHPHKKKLRVVHDAAAKCAGVSLNSLLLTGPDLLQPLLSIVMRFREGPVALTGDIREMFPQIKIRPEERDSQRFLWRDNPGLPLQEFRMSSMIFGAASSPCTALWVKNKNASQFQSRYPDAVRSIVEDHYMDDFLGSFDSISEAAQRAFEIWSIHKAACFEMRSWVSNYKEALALIPTDLHATDATTEVSLGPTSPSQIRVLGLTWNTSEDSLCFVKSLPKAPTKFTKRSALSLLMSIYDPLGFLTPVIMKGRALFQKTWKLGIDWDHTLPVDLIEDWKSWLLEIQKLSYSSVPRCYFRDTGRIKNAQLHVFADASERAYACVAYWRFTDDADNVSLSLVGGKGRLAPLKPVSIPRLELQAALIASRFSVYITEAHRRTPNQVYFWTDSLTVLKWLRSDVCTFRAFVSFRLGEITETTNIHSWRYVPTALNVADDATRDTHNFSTSSRWFTGPTFLLSPPSDWPCEPTCAIPPVTEELKRVSESVGLLVASPRQRQLPSPVVADHQRFSSWTRFLRATARTHQYIDKFRSILRPNSKFSQNALRDARNLFTLSVEDLNVAEVHLFRKVQIDSFPEDLMHVLTARPVSSDSRLRNLSLLFGEDGLLRLSGRTAAAEYVESRPIVLDGRHPIVKLMIHSYHVRYAHGHNELVVNELRQRFYILSLRPAVRGTSQRCQFCRNRKAKPESPPEGDLPKARLAHHQRPFTYVGLDYFGPLNVAIGRRTAKRWIALFTCLTVRAVHLEIVETLSSDSALMAIRRFISRRGCPTMIYSDNGTSFVGAAKMLPELFNFCANRRIEWRFIPPSAPFMGGCWERLVRSVKNAIAVTLKQRTPKEDVLNTLLLEAECTINSRPLTHVSVDADAENALTPFTFLIGSPSSEPDIKVFDDADLLRRADWRKAQRLADHFWQRFVLEYLPTLTPRRRLQDARPLRVGDLVFIADGTLPRNQWPRGRITAVHPGKDGIVRVVDVTTKGGVLRRPTRKVVLLVAGQ